MLKASVNGTRRAASYVLVCVDTCLTFALRLIRYAVYFVFFLHPLPPSLFILCYRTAVILGMYVLCFSVFWPFDR